MKEDIAKMCMMVFAICCLTVCMILNVQIAIQNNQLQAGKLLQERMQRLEEERAVNISNLEKEKENLKKNADKAMEGVQDALEKYDDIRYEINNEEQAYELLESEYDKLLYLDEVVLELDKENGSHDYVERYFQIDKRSLQEVLKEMPWQEELGAQFPEMEKWGELLPVGDQIWNLYAPDSSPDSYPLGVLIQNPLIDFGYKDARAGMNLLDIKARYPESRREDKKLSDGNFRYLQYEDKNCRYYYVTVDHCVDCTILYVTQR